MKQIILLSSFLVSIITVEAQQASDAISMFAFDLYRNISLNNNDNIVFSPFSITPAFGMVALGAKSETENQIEKVFHFPNNKPAFHTSLGKLQKKIQSNVGDSVIISITNRVWIEKTYAVSSKFNKSLKKCYSAKIGSIDFIHNPDESRISINNTVQKDTKDFIKDLLPDGSIDDLTRLVLTNAIYFKGKWAVPFDPKKTNQRDFVLSSGEKVKCPTMVAESDYGYFKGDNYEALQLNYKGGSLSMLILLPNEGVKISEFEKNFDFGLYQNTLKEISEEKLWVYLPKFKIETGLSLKNTLSDMGMPIAFSNDADFSGIAGKNNLKISNAFHKAFIEVSEAGTTAAAATAVVVVIKSMPRFNNFIVNRPFIYILKHNSSNTILFMGKVENPSK